MFTRSLKPIRVGLILLAAALCAPAAMGQMMQPDTSKMLSSSDVSQQQVQKFARIVVDMRMATRADRMKMRKEMQSKYGNPQQMDSTQKAQARREMRRRQMKMRKKQMQVMQKKTKEEGMSTQMVQQIMRAAQQDSTLQKRIQSAMKAEMKKRQAQNNQGSPNQQR